MKQDQITYTPTRILRLIIRSTKDNLLGSKDRFPSIIH